MCGTNTKVLKTAKITLKLQISQFEIFGKL